MIRFMFFFFIYHEIFQTSNFDIDIMNDAIGFLWKRCKRILQKCSLEEIENPKKFVERLNSIDKVLIF